jgi:SAM-dependent methyltransferase
MDVLDLGVGGGRTTPYLSCLAQRYVGVDYAAEMVKVCREKFPQLDFVEADAADMAMLPNNSFDVVFFSFNGLDVLSPDEKRRSCLSECHRLLRAGGMFIFSSHNPRALAVRPGWDPARVRAFSRHLRGEHRLLYPLTVAAATAAKATLATLRAAAATARRMAHRIVSRTFWRGEGYMLDSAHGRLATHYFVPEKAVFELERCGFRCLEVLGDDYPRKSRSYVTDWYYYVFSRES